MIHIKGVIKSVNRKINHKAAFPYFNGYGEETFFERFYQGEAMSGRSQVCRIV